jgi:YtxH-like protein
MREQTVADKVKSWSSIAASVGVLLAQPKVRAKIEAVLKDRINSLSDNIGGKYDDVAGRVGHAYDDVAGRVGNAADAFRGRNQWQDRALTFAIGLGIGAGLGIMLAPKSGRATRSAMRDTAVNFKDTVVDSASAAVGKATRIIA